LKEIVAKANSSGRFLDAADADAGCANTHLLAGAINDRANVPQVGIPPAPTRIVRVADHVTKGRALAAQFTLRHLFVLLCGEFFEDQKHLSVTDLRA
jgi:hypothetical protein